LLRTRSSASSPSSACTPVTLEAGAQVVNSTKGKKERIGKLFQMHANKVMPVEGATAGHIYAVIGLKDTTTGDTLTDPPTRSSSSR
jgi:translation elongation factor EF-G